MSRKKEKQKKALLFLTFFNVMFFISSLFCSTLALLLLFWFVVLVEYSQCNNFVLKKASRAFTLAPNYESNEEGEKINSATSPVRVTAKKRSRNLRNAEEKK